MMSQSKWMHVLIAGALVFSLALMAGCKGEDGAAGAGGVSLALVTTPEPAGVNCAYGGYKVEAGPDANNDSVPDTVTSTRYVCNGAPGDTGDTGGDLSVASRHATSNNVVVSNQAAAISGADVVISYDLLVDGAARTDYTLVAGAYRHSYNAAVLTGTVKNPYERTSITASSVNVVRSMTAGRYTATIPGLASAVTGTDTTFMLSVNKADGTGTEATVATVVAHLNAPSRNIVSNAACINCHGNNVFREGHHGVKPIGATACVVCHVRYDRSSRGAGGDRLMSYVHGIHNSHNMVSRVIGSTTIPDETYPRNDSESESNWHSITYPSDMQNCKSCHDTTASLATVLAEPVSWSLCISCHDSWDSFSRMVAGTIMSHATYTQGTPASTCAGCHDGITAPATAASFHNGAVYAAGANQENEKGKDIRTEITGVVVSGTTATVTWRAYNPNTSADYDPCNTDLNNGPVFFGATGISSNTGLRVGYAQGNDWVNAGIGTSPGQPVSAPSLTTNATANGYTTCASNVATSKLTLSSTSATKAIVALTGRPHVSNPLTTGGISRARFPNATREFVVADGSAPAAADKRRTIVDTTKCLACHQGTLYQHGGDRVDNVEHCDICHNPASNDKNNRVGMGVNASEAYDGKMGQTYDMRTMIHGIHSAGRTGAPLVYYRSNGIYYWGSEAGLPATWPTATVSTPVYGSDTHAYTGATITATSRVHNYHTCDYPRPLNACEACHVAGSYDVPNQGKAVAVTDQDAGGGTLVTTSSATWGIQTDDVLIGPAAAACMSCHQSSDTLVQAALKKHASDNGWAPSTFPNGRADLLNGSGGLETCVVCHGN